MLAAVPGVIYPLIFGNEILVSVIDDPNNGKCSEVNVFYSVAPRGTSNLLSLATLYNALDYKICTRKR